MKPFPVVVLAKNLLNHKNFYKTTVLGCCAVLASLTRQKQDLSHVT